MQHRQKFYWIGLDIWKEQYNGSMQICKFSTLSDLKNFLIDLCTCCFQISLNLLSTFSKSKESVMSFSQDCRCKDLNYKQAIVVFWYVIMSFSLWKDLSSLTTLTRAVIKHETTGFVCSCPFSTFPKILLAQPPFSALV